MAKQINEQELTPLDLERVLLLAEVSDFTTLSRDTIVRNYPQWVIRLSPRRRGMKFKHALLITKGE